jgi:hypothetical protein
MSYNTSIPVITDPILQSQAQIKANFQAINYAFSDNHKSLTSDPSFAGMHTVLTMRPQKVDPVTSATQTALYNKLVSSIPNLFFMPNNAQTPIQMTFGSINAGSGTTQYSFIAGPFVVYAGFISNPTSGQIVTLSPATTLLFVDLTMANSNVSPTAIAEAIPTNVAGSSFTITTQTFIAGTKYDLYYIAIGKP